MEAIELKEPLNESKPCSEEAVQVFVKKSEKQKSAESGGKIIWRGANAMMTLFFVLASGVQFNDPDPFLWVPLYGTAAILTTTITIRPNLSENKIWRYGSLNPLTYEEGREMAGIMITAIWLFVCKQSPTISSSDKQKSTKKRSMMVASVLLLSLFPLMLWALCYSDVMSSSYISLCSDFYFDEFSF
ncbi:uncharacterized protein TNIN_417601 [Trichonephila inaurata madagascariensis]|uniref:Transmembrane protein 220 n=1 Tax=Trichonephila inaurata madagascariensis TaxID=2747483 RepID=A0A8X6IZP4_9ARAC|nr:uncharacterized protein TNIN_417601 [Trichonephila inaurata madagascariensis]